MHFSQSLAANQRLEVVDAFDHVRVLDAASGITLEFMRDGRKLDEVKAITTGYSEDWAEPCDRLVIVNGGTAQTVTLVTRVGAVVNFDRPPSGATTNTQQAATSVTQNAATVTNASGQLLAASARKTLMIQNKSATGNVWVNLAGAACTQANGLRIGPGETFAMDTRTPGGIITAIGDLASNAEVLCVECM